jgi:hypothetical protein
MGRVSGARLEHILKSSRGMIVRKKINRILCTENGRVARATSCVTQTRAMSAEIIIPPWGARVRVFNITLERKSKALVRK